MKINEEDTPLVVLKNDNQFDMAVNTLTKMEEVENTIQKTPIQEVEESLTNFLKKAMEITLANNKLSDALEQSLISDLDSMSTEEKLTLYNLSKQSENDRWAKLINPVLGTMESRNQSANKKEESNNTAVQINVGTAAGDSKIAESVTPEIIGGLNTLNALIQSMNNTPVQNIQ